MSNIFWRYRTEEDTDDAIFVKTYKPSVYGLGDTIKLEVSSIYFYEEYIENRMVCKIPHQTFILNNL
ncbi:hypothetical protein DKW60_15155 [Leucothrix pacifica]|uniref:Uncharacterized protein n=1 Tax=Leucothrix pacifica TaxID=1247513 RepID=A0A317C9Y1_9GAMM|nr:hypothetical protein DKW60_15155 [Leucothrix pacifica]